MEDFIRWIRQEGKPILMTVNTPFLMDDREHIWFVDTGHINIYTVTLEEGEQEGKRYYFSSIPAQEIFIGVDSKNSFTQIGLWADATAETVLYQLDLEQFKSQMFNPALKPILVHLLEKWVDNICYALSENENHPNEQAELLVKEGDRVILRDNELISSQRKPVWAKVE